MEPKYQKSDIVALDGQRVIIHDVTLGAEEFLYWVDVPDVKTRILHRTGLPEARLQSLSPEEQAEVNAIRAAMKDAKLRGYCPEHGAFDYPMYDDQGFHQFHIIPKCPQSHQPPATPIIKRFMTWWRSWHWCDCHVKYIDQKGGWLFLCECEICGKRWCETLWDHP